jgi:uncharacterized membrane protein
MSLLDYFLYPQTSGYDVPKTLLYGVVLVIAAYLIYKLLKKLKVKVDRRLAVAVAPYVVFGSATRVLVDSGIFNSYFLVTPGIYFLVTSIVISLLFLSIVLDKKKNIPYFKTLFISGVLLSSFPISFVRPVNFYAALVVAFLFAPWPLILKFVKWKNENKFVTMLHMFDATTTFTAMSFFGYYEQHVLPSFIIGLSHPAIFILAKAVVVVSSLIAIDKFSSDKEFNNYIKLCIGILGAATGARDFLRLVAMV